MHYRVWGPLLGLLALAAGSRSAPERIDFSREIKPLLAKNCFACHGPDEKSLKANLRLDSPNRAVIPGDPLASGLVRRVLTMGPQQMPPASSGHSLTATEKSLLTRWVAEGGGYTPHWAFVPPKRAVGASIDRLVQATLRAKRLTPAPEADRDTLLRRVSLDLIGLPPTPEETAAFLADTRPDAYERVVDRLLASPRYGEHWARLWLDLARYADTKGYEKDQPRTIWRWRDWVIDAFNADMPFDQFTIEQLAGDLLPNATDSQHLATAFHRNTMTNDEGGTDDEEFRQVAVKDRVDTTLQVWMGLTMGCAKCHSHKYDPISQKDYYRFYALFNQTEDNDRYDDSPTLLTPTAEQVRRRTTLDTELAAIRAEAAQRSPERDAWERALDATSFWKPLEMLHTILAQSGATVTIQQDGRLLVSGEHKTTDRITLLFHLSSDKPLTALRLEALKDPSLPKGGPGRDTNDQNVVISELTVAWLRDGKRTPLTLTKPRADFEQVGWPVANALDNNPATGWAWAPQNAQPHVAVFELATPLLADAGTLEVTLEQNYPNLSLGCFRLSVSTAEPALLTATLSPLAEPKQRDEAYLKLHNPARFATLEKLQAERDALEKAIPRTPVYRELPTARQRVTHIHQRGNFLDPGETVTPAVLTTFGKLPANATLNRLGAAQWLVSPENPLTARVLANRLWARLFGMGIVETEEDFGTQGASPSQPALLDYLALHLRDDCHWSIKRFLRTVVLSQTYRRSSRLTPTDLAQDPRNRWLARGPRFRLSAEAIRDQALAASGLLSAKVGGPSVFPPQPPGVWKTTYSSLKWETSPGEDRWRRGLYTFWRRTSPYPAMTTFDAGSGEVCLIRRVRTNTPLQALITLNDPVFVEAAGALGRMLTRRGLSYGFRAVLTRPPTPAETQRLTALFQATLAEYRTRPTDAAALLPAAHLTAQPSDDPAVLAAWTVVANVLLNLDETVTKP